MGDPLWAVMARGFRGGPSTGYRNVNLTFQKRIIPKETSWPVSLNLWANGNVPPFQSPKTKYKRLSSLVFEEVSPTMCNSKNKKKPSFLVMLPPSHCQPLPIIARFCPDAQLEWLLVPS